MWDSVSTLAIQGGPWGLVSLFVVSILTGRLIPRRSHLDRVGDLKDAIGALEDTVVELKQQNAMLMGRDPHR